MSSVVLNNIPCRIDLLKLQEKLHVKDDESLHSEIAEMAAAAQLIARPKVLFKRSPIQDKGNDFVMIDGIKFFGQLLRVNLEEASEVFPYIVTCGTEIEVWSKQFDDLFQSYCAETIKEMVLNSARGEFEAHLRKEFGLEHSSNMNPGSLPNWPLAEQKRLFDLFGNVEELIGVRLTDSFFLLPIKSVSGIRFYKESKFENCLMCPRKNCPNRKAPFNEKMSERFR